MDSTSKFSRKKTPVQYEYDTHTAPGISSWANLSCFFGTGSRGDFLCPAAEHRHARPAALGAGIEHKVIAAVQDSIHCIRTKRFQLLNKISVYNALHVRKDNGIALGQLLQPTKMVIVVMCHDHQIICTG